MARVMKKIARNHGHSTNMQAAQVAVEAGAKTPLAQPYQCPFPLKRYQPAQERCGNDF